MGAIGTADVSIDGRGEVGSWQRAPSCCSPSERALPCRSIEVQRQPLTNRHERRLAAAPFQARA